MTPTKLSEASGISVPYASQIINGRTPPLALAIHLLRTAGYQHECLAGLSARQLEKLGEQNPWVPRKKAEAA